MQAYGQAMIYCIILYSITHQNFVLFIRFVYRSLNFNTKLLLFRHEPKNVFLTEYLKKVVICMFTSVYI